MKMHCDSGSKRRRRSLVFGAAFATMVLSFLFNPSTLSAQDVTDPDALSEAPSEVSSPDTAAEAAPESGTLAEAPEAEEQAAPADELSEAPLEDLPSDMATEAATESETPAEVDQAPHADELSEAPSADKAARTVRSDRSAVTIRARTDTGYQLALGDNAMVNRAYNYESIDLGIDKGLSLSMYGGLLTAIGPHTNTSDASGNPEASDNSLRNLQDALNGNPGTWVSYSLYKLQVSYSTEMFGLSFGRTAGMGSAMAPYDGLSCWYTPMDWLRIEAFGGHPWQDANVARFADLPAKLAAGEYEVGGSVSATLLEGSISTGLGYVLLSQSSYAGGLGSGAIGSTTTVVQSGLGSASVAWNPTNLFSAGLAASFINITPLDISAWASGTLESAYLTYNLRTALQPVDATAVANSFNAFASVLGASKAFFSASLDLTEDVTGFFTMPGYLKYAQVELGCDYRQPLGTADAWNPQYLQFRVGPLVAFDKGLSVSAYWNYLLGLSSADNINTISGEIREKIASFDFRLGTSFDANKFEANSATNSILESVDTQEYYLKAKWQATKAFDLSLKASYSSSLYGTTTAPALTDSTLYPAITTVSTQLNDQARTSMRLEIRAGYRY
jgi:hypothetical protein